MHFISKMRLCLVPKFQYPSKTGVNDFSEKYGVLLQGKTNLAGYDSLQNIKLF